MENLESILLDIYLATSFDVTDAKYQAALQVASGFQTIEQALMLLGAE
jgi:hypothetical protein